MCAALREFRIHMERQGQLQKKIQVKIYLSITLYYTCTVNNSIVKRMKNVLECTAEWFRTMPIIQFPLGLRSFWSLF